LYGRKCTPQGEMQELEYVGNGNEKHSIVFSNGMANLCAAEGPAASDAQCWLTPVRGSEWCKPTLSVQGPCICVTTGHLTMGKP